MSSPELEQSSPDEQKRLVPYILASAIIATATQVAIGNAVLEEKKNRILQQEEIPKIEELKLIAMVKGTQERVAKQIAQCEKGYSQCDDKVLNWPDPGLKIFFGQPEARTQCTKVELECLNGINPLITIE